MCVKGGVGEGTEAVCKDDLDTGILMADLGPPSSIYSCKVIQKALGSGRGGFCVSVLRAGGRGAHQLWEGEEQCRKGCLRIGGKGGGAA